MDTDPQIELSKAFYAVLAYGIFVKEDTRNSQLNNKYADLGAVIAAALPVLATNGLALSCSPGLIRESDKHFIFTVNTRVYHKSGAYELFVSEWTFSKEPPKPLNIAQTQGLTLAYARRYIILSLLGISAGDDDDGARLMDAIKGEDQGPKFTPHWSDLIKGEWDGHLVDGYKTPLGEMSDDEKAALVRDKSHLKSPALVAFLWDRADRMMVDKGLSYADRPAGFPDDFRDMDANSVKAFCAWAKTAEAKPANDGEVQA